LVFGQGLREKGPPPFLKPHYIPKIRGFYPRPPLGFPKRGSSPCNNVQSDPTFQSHPTTPLPKIRIPLGQGNSSASGQKRLWPFGSSTPNIHYPIPCPQRTNPFSAVPMHGVNTFNPILKLICLLARLSIDRLPASISLSICQWILGHTSTQFDPNPFNRKPLNCPSYTSPLFWQT